MQQISQDKTHTQAPSTQKPHKTPIFFKKKKKLKEEKKEADLGKKIENGLDRRSTLLIIPKCAPPKTSGGRRIVCDPRA